jgi:eukaryotic-like serine/threonine-protein kinase
MRSEEYAKFSGQIGAGWTESVGREALREGWDVLRLAAQIEVPRRWSPEEIARAGRWHDDRRLAEALRYAGEYGVAEYLAAAPQLLADWRDAWAPATHPRAAAMVLAAVDARRSGVHRPLPMQVLLSMHEPYLKARDGDRLRPESAAAAVEWGTSPLYATSSLLIPTDIWRPVAVVRRGLCQLPEPPGNSGRPYLRPGGPSWRIGLVNAGIAPGSSPPTGAVSIWPPSMTMV